MSKFASKFDYLLNAMVNAASQSDPSKHGYGAKRRAVLEYVSALERKLLRSPELPEERETIVNECATVCLAYYQEDHPNYKFGRLFASLLYARARSRKPTDPIPEGTLPEERDSIPVSDILRQIDHIKRNGLSLAKYGGSSAEEGRCRELCAMYLREFIINLLAQRNLEVIDAAIGDKSE